MSDVLGGRPTPVVNGVVRVNFLVLVPCSLVHPEPGAPSEPQAKTLVQFGHGLLGDRGEIKQRVWGEMAQENKWLFFATDWEGMSFADTATAVRLFLNDVSDFATVPERLAQGFVNKCIMARMMRPGGSLTTSSALANAAGKRQLATYTHRYHSHSVTQLSLLAGWYPFQESAL